MAKQTQSERSELSFVILARPGHFRDSLEALLRTIPKSDLIIPLNPPCDLAAEPVLAAYPEREARLYSSLECLEKSHPDLVVVDLDALDEACVSRLAMLRSRLPGANWLALSNDPRRSRLAKRLEVDCILAKSTPAGEFLQTVHQLGQRDRLTGPAIRRAGNLLHAFTPVVIHR
jgi:hypothetical protein